MRSVWHDVHAFGTPSLLVVDWRNELERVAADADIAHGPRDGGHVARHAATARAGCLVLGVLLDGAERAGLALRSMALQADGVAWQAEIGVVLSAVRRRDSRST